MSESLAIKEEKEYVYVPKSLAKQIKALEDGKEKEMILISFIERSREDIRLSLESLDEDVKIYNGSMAKYKQVFREIKDSQIKEVYEIWEKAEDELGLLYKKAKEKAEQIQYLAEEVKRYIEKIKTNVYYINEQCNQINVYRFKDLMKLLEDFGKLSQETKEMFIKGIGGEKQ